MLKMSISSIRFLGRHNGRHRDDKVTIEVTRLLGRCLGHKSGQDCDCDLLSTGANVAKWERAAELAKEEYESGGAASKLILLPTLPVAALDASSSGFLSHCWRLDICRSFSAISRGCIHVQLVAEGSGVVVGWLQGKHQLFVGICLGYGNCQSGKQA
jgi:hypothetical protein